MAGCNGSTLTRLFQGLHITRAADAESWRPVCAPQGTPRGQARNDKATAWVALEILEAAPLSGALPEAGVSGHRTAEIRRAMSSAGHVIDCGILSTNSAAVQGFADRCARELRALVHPVGQALAILALGNR